MGFELDMFMKVECGNFDRCGNFIKIPHCDWKGIWVCSADCAQYY